MMRFEDHTRRFWNLFVSKAERWMKDSPHIDWELIIAAQKHIEFLEYSNAWKLTLLENAIARGLSQEVMDGVVAEVIESERKLLENTL